MATKPLLSGEILIECESSRYEELIAAEERLYILEAAIRKLNIDDAEFYLFKKMFNLEDLIKLEDGKEGESGNE